MRPQIFRMTTPNLKRMYILIKCKTDCPNDNLPTGGQVQKLGYHILNDITWFKDSGSPNLSCKFFTASHEPILCVRKDKNAKHNFNYEAKKDGHFPGIPNEKATNTGACFSFQVVTPTH